MNVLIAAYYATPSSGNFIGSLIELGERLCRKGDILSFIFPRNDNTERQDSWVEWLQSEGFSVHLLDMNYNEAEQLAFLKTIIIKENVDILHIHFGLFQSIVLSNRKDIPCKVIIHEHMEYPAGCNKIKQTLRFTARSLKFRIHQASIVSVCKTVDTAHIFAHHWFVPNGLSYKRNIPYSQSREACREKYGIKESEKAILFLGWDLYRKGLDIAVQAVNEIHKKDPSIILCLVGLGERPEPSKQATEYIRERTGIDPLSDWIRYLSGGEDMFACHRAMDAYLSSSRSEAFSYGILEAISQNVPVVVSDIKGTSWCHAYNKSFVYPVEDAYDCAKALQKALQIRTAESNHQTVTKKYSIEDWCDKIITIYTKVMHM